MKKIIITSAIFVLIFFDSIGQINTDNYQLIKKIDRPLELKWGIPSEIMIDSTLRILVIAYDYNPTYLDFFDIDNWEKISQVKIRGYTTLDLSYFDLDNNCVYIEKGKIRYNYIKVDLSDFSTTKVNRNQTHDNCNGCSVTSDIRHYDEQSKTTTITRDWYALCFNEKMTEIYLSLQ